MPERRQTKEFEKYVERMQHPGDMVNLLGQLMASHTEKIVMHRDEVVVYYDQIAGFQQQIIGIQEQQLRFALVARGGDFPLY